ncbi:MAG: hypothetical protein JXR30_01915, partial [Alphaproteobacteria bacterium]|nr:hypothetical protein [Alphaproteobacteria bacterium]
KLSRFLNKTCGIEKSKTTDLAERIKSETHKTVCELITDIKDTGSLTYANAESCMKQINAKYPGK